LDANENPAENYSTPIRLTTQAPTGGTAIAARTATPVAGLAYFNGITLNNAADGYVLTATSATFTPTTSNPFNVTAARFGFSTIPNGVIYRPFSVTVTAFDANGNRAENFGSPLELSVDVPAGGGGFAANPTVTAGNGVARFDGLVLTRPATGYRLKAATASLPSVDSSTFDVSDRAPDTTITSVPAHYSQANTATFTMASTGTVPAARFECRYEGTGEWTSCSSPVSDGTVTAPVADGTHTFDVRAVGESGLADPTPAHWTWVVDTRAPTVTVQAPVDGGVYGAGSQVSASFTCRDAGGSGIATCDGTVAAGSPIDTTPGSHTFTVAAVDRAGNRRTTTVTYQAR
ncbi:MAG: large repetitive protein, partial [Acidimicrobiaceae bacterium]|nr:large repetitive protein [Acidimicrobiaceae bacterium]